MEKVGIISIERVHTGFLLRLDTDIIANQCTEPKEGVAVELLNNWLFSLFARHGSGIKQTEVLNCREIVVRTQHLPESFRQIIAGSVRFALVGDPDNDTSGSPEILDFAVT